MIFGQSLETMVMVDRTQSRAQFTAMVFVGWTIRQFDTIWLNSIWQMKRDKEYK